MNHEVLIIVHYYIIFGMHCMHRMVFLLLIDVELTLVYMVEDISNLFVTQLPNHNLTINTFQHAHGECCQRR